MSNPWRAKGSGNETIPFAVDGEDVSGIRRILLELEAKSPDVRIDRPRADVRVVVPYLAEHPRPGDGLVAKADQHVEDLELLRREVQPLAISRREKSLEIEPGYTLAQEAIQKLRMLLQ